MSWINLIKNISPVLGSALGGPLGGIATKLILDTFDIKDGTSNEDIINKITEDSNQKNKFKNIENEFQIKLKELQIHSNSLMLADVKDARETEIKRGNNTQTWLTFTITFGFFSLLSMLLFVDIDTDVKNILNIMVGSLGTAWVGIVNYYYGSSIKQRNP